MNTRWLLLLLWVIGLALLLNACAAAPQPTSQPAAEVVKPTSVVIEKEVEVKTQVAAEEPAEPTTKPPPATPLAKPTAFPTLIPPSPTVPTIPIATAIVEARTVELEWPATLRLGESDIVRLALIPSTEGYSVTSEYPEHQVITKDVPVPRPGGYELSAVARLDGAGFDISPSSEQEHSLPVGQAVTWRWSLAARQEGRQRLSVTLVLRWTPAPGAVGLPRQVPVYSRGLEVRVTSFLGLTRGAALATGFFGLLFGSSLSLAAFAFRRPVPLAKLETSQPNPALALEPRPGLALAPAENALLRALFRRYSRLVLESEFLSGYSGARTFLAHPIRPDGRADAYTIVKIGAAGSIQREFANYESFVKDTLPPITARIQHPPVAVAAASGSQGRRGPRTPGLAAIQYTFIGEPGSSPTSLRQALLKNPDPALLTRLFDTFGPNWWMQRRPYTFRLAVEYDRLLPTHYVLEPVSARVQPLDGRASPAEVRLEIGDCVSLRHFTNLELRPDGQSLSLRGVPAPGQPPLRLRWLGVNDPNGASGRVVASRQSILNAAVAGFDRLGLPDPLLRLPELLAETVAGTQSTIHGDLNLENILVGPGGMVWLIDFAQTRDGHPLADFAHLEAELIAHILAPQVASPLEFLAILESERPAESQARISPDAPSTAHSVPSAPGHAPFSALLTTLHASASRCLFNPSQPREYHLACCLACLGALKFVNLEPYPKHLLYLTAAHLSLRL